ncbi:sensor histidine kinase [Allostreptomyces psammosilenae]|uniref:histidine kinase n=1 Tax=Allostreptomyces psammosilenae TaxID=1892865 RepID=A0A853ACQ9_9ACTN|nr:HAMP domain-containing sensor histidine kinase [Allostreptomyces psammosilenae]NYI08142.1 two-component system OmpR family sensor kinase [Allostreptomyces psammosilenae]
MTTRADPSEVAGDATDAAKAAPTPEATGAAGRRTGRIRPMPWWCNMTLRHRLLILLLSTTAVVLAFQGFFSTRVLSNQLAEVHDQEMRFAAESIRQLLDGQPDVRARASSGVPPVVDPGAQMVATLLEPDGGRTELISQRGFHPELPSYAEALRLADSGEVRTSADSALTRQYRVVALRLRSSPEVLVVTDPDSLRGTARTVVPLNVAFTGAGLLLLGVATVVVVRRELRPLETMARQAEAVASGDLGRRVELSRIGSEVGQLGVALNRSWEAVQAALQARDASERRLRRFVADASHELRTPLQSIRGYTDLYRHGALPDTAAVDRAVERIAGETRRMSRLVEQLLLLARYDSEQLPERVPVDLGVLVRESAADAAAVQPDRPFEVEVADGVQVRGDPDALSRLVANLLANVRQHTPVEAGCWVRLRGEGGTAVLTVTDAGPGVPPDALPHIFDRFYRADPARSRASGGTGLGLAIVDTVARAHGGEAVVDSRPGEGTTVTVRLPRARRTDVAVLGLPAPGKTERVEEAHLAEARGAT